MRFSAIAVTLFASAVMAESTVWVTDEITITSCAPTVTNCPAKSTVTSVTSYPVVATTSAPVYANTSAPVSKTTVYTYPTSAAGGAGASGATYPSLSTETISTCIPTVIYSTVTVAPTTAKTSYPVSTYPASKNATKTAAPAAFTGAASSVQGSIAFAAVAGVAAFLFA